MYMLDALRDDNNGGSYGADEIDDDISIVAQGGGMQGAWIAGFLMGLKDEYGFTSPDYMAGTSAAIADFTYFAANQMEGFAEYIWEEKVGADEFASIWHLVEKDPPCIFDVEYLVDDVMAEGVDIPPDWVIDRLAEKGVQFRAYGSKEDLESRILNGEIDGEDIYNMARAANIPDDFLQEPHDTALDVESLKESDIELIVPVTDLEEGEAHYFDSEEDEDFYDNIFEILKAAMAEQTFSGAKVEMNGQKYVDAVYTDPIPIEAPKVEDTQKIILLTKTEEQTEHSEISEYLKSVGESIQAWAVGKLRGSSLVHEIMDASRDIYVDGMDKAVGQRDEGDIVVRPSEEISKTDNDPESIRKTIKQGFQDAKNNDELRGFMEALRESEQAGQYFAA